MDELRFYTVLIPNVQMNQYTQYYFNVMSNQNGYLVDTNDKCAGIEITIQPWHNYQFLACEEVNEGHVTHVSTMWLEAFSAHLLYIRIFSFVAIFLI